MKEKQTPEGVTAQIITGLSEILDKEKPDLVLVHGDTTTTFAGAYAAFLKKIPVGHVEAGLRTGDITSPFPEEANRQLVGRIASYHFSATEKNKENLLNEGVNPSSIAVVGNTVIDALLATVNKPFSYPEELKPIIERKKKIILMTTHRRENLEQLTGIYTAINSLMAKHEDIELVFPVHKNPAVRAQVEKGLKSDPRIHLVEPLDYETFAHLMKDSYFIISDSGGIQEEAPALGKPVLVARTNTERPEGVLAGTLKLVGTDADTIFKEANALLSDDSVYQKMSEAKNPYGDGTYSKQIISFIKQHGKRS
jgi:UDP-N-acetylglucosamine 2-epimerase (non-hydrolysing)